MRVARSLRVLIVALAGAIGGSCHDKVTGPRAELSPAVADYIDTAFNFTEDWFYFSEKVDWTALRALTYRRAYGATKTSDAYAALDSMMKALHDRHSLFYVPTKTVGTSNPPPEVVYYRPFGGSFTPRIGYLWIPTFTGTNQLARADSIQRAIAKVDSLDNLCGWIVDLRGNPGGYWAPMLAGMSPLMGEGIAGGYVMRNPTQRYLYEIHPGAAGVQLPTGDYFEFVRLPSSYQMRRPNLPIAILQNGQTASAGEILLMGLRRDPLSPRRTFGTNSFGATTQPLTKVLADTSSIQVAAGIFFDKYDSKFPDYVIPPDHFVQGPSFGTGYVPGAAKDVVVDSANVWLGQQASCRQSAVLSPQAAAVIRDGGTWVPTRAAKGARAMSAWPKGVPMPLQNLLPR
jgi:carboxyl-terminal processing protease